MLVLKSTYDAALAEKEERIAKLRKALADADGLLISADDHMVLLDGQIASAIRERDAARIERDTAQRERDSYREDAIKFRGLKSHLIRWTVSRQGVSFFQRRFCAGGGVMVQIADLVGEHVLETVPRTDIRHPMPGSDAGGALFTLSGTTYLIFEDEDDGYRSAAGPIMSFEGGASALGVGSYYPQYINEPVLCSHSVVGEYDGVDDILEIRSKETGDVVFRVGTANVDDYYPGFVCEWRPEGLSANAKSRVNL